MFTGIQKLFAESLNQTTLATINGPKEYLYMYAYFCTAASLSECGDANG